MCGNLQSQGIASNPTAKKKSTDQLVLMVYRITDRLTEQEKHNDSDNSRSWPPSRHSSSQDSHTNCLTGGSEHHQLTTAKAVDDPDGNQ
jgi:hypothetical protein